MLLSTAQQDYHKEKKVAIDRWGRQMEAITLNYCCVGMGCIAFCLTVKDAGQFDGIQKLGPTFQAFVNPDILAEGAVEN